MRDRYPEPQLSIENLEPPPGYAEAPRSPEPEEPRGVAVIWPPAEAE